MLFGGPEAQGKFMNQGRGRKGQKENYEEKTEGEKEEGEGTRDGMKRRREEEWRSGEANF